MRVSLMFIVFLFLVNLSSAKVWQTSFADVDGDMEDEMFEYVIGEFGEHNIPYVYCPWVTMIAWRTIKTCLSIRLLRQQIFLDTVRILDTGLPVETSPFYYIDTLYNSMSTYIDSIWVITTWESDRAILSRVVNLDDERLFMRYCLYLKNGGMIDTLGETAIFVVWNDGETTVQGAQQYVLNQLGKYKNLYIDSFPIPDSGQVRFRIRYAWDDFAKQLDSFSIWAWDGGSTNNPTVAMFGDLHLPKPSYLFTSVSSQNGAETTHVYWDFKPSGVRNTQIRKKSTRFNVTVKPVPFRRKVNFAVSLPEAGSIDIKIYNSMGALIRGLKSEFLLPGRYEFIWDGKDWMERKCPAALYFYVVQYKIGNKVEMVSGPITKL
ncbi:hypothetical protein DRP53_01430 [candidate division WOR-3 bacterium]|uniref:FlgD Ig-like domain-containing protein n=1 Tax=candidate division WOR-3 bacterium TaxID=2052148 RepID=A0A660SMX8_UNCW3|nr:MAG: hypothetical protein DRP53_01430 [candidate division WOR-3 bacterium]